jgi:predicted nucleic acid-binding protein
MTRFGIDAGVAIRLARERISVSPQHRLVAPSLLRSQALSTVYRAVRGGELEPATARAIMDGITTMRIRLLGDRVSRGTAWRLAEKLDWPDTPDAEYIAVAQLQADAFVTLDADLAERARGLVSIAPFDALLTPAG